MATGILSVGLHLTGHEALSRVVLVTACAAWTLLAANFTHLLLSDRAGWVARADTPGALTAVAATAVLGTRFSLLGWTSVAAALLALAALLWPALLMVVVRHWGRRMPGSVFLGCVATEGLAALGATLAAVTSTAWLAHTALVLFWSGLLLYAAALMRFDVREVARGAGDHWVSGGALAISALAGAILLDAADSGMHLWNDDDSAVLRHTTVALLAVALACCAVLAVFEAVRPRLRYDVRRWSTVFPLGMAAVATLSVASTLDITFLEKPGQGLVWIALAAWAAVAVGAGVSRWAERTVRGPQSAGPAARPDRSQ